MEVLFSLKKSRHGLYNSLQSDDPALGLGWIIVSLYIIQWKWSSVFFLNQILREK